MRALLGRASTGAVLVLAIGACGTSEPLGISGNSSGNNGVVEAEYDIALKKWQEGAPAHYVIVVQQTCECSSDLQRATKVTVRRVGGQQVEDIESVVDAATNGAVTMERRLAAKSVDGLLVLIQQALALNPQDARVTYDATLGYPISINIDPVTSIQGDEVVYKVTSFQALP